MNDWQQQPAVPGPAQVVQGQCFRFAVPHGWRVVEEGAYAVVLCAPDNSAITMLVGNCGFMPGVDPVGYAFEKIAATGAQNLRVGQPRPGRPFAGFGQAFEFEYAYLSAGVPCRGLAAVSVRHGYNAVDLVLTAAAAQEAHWPRYAGWLPAVAAQAAATSPAAFGSLGVAQQNLHNSMALGQTLQEHRDHSWRLQQELADQRDQSDTVRNQARGEALTGHAWYPDPYGNPPQRLSTAPAVHWVDPQGRVVSSDDPTFDPRTPADPYWQRMTPPLPSLPPLPK